MDSNPADGWMTSCPVTDYSANNVNLSPNTTYNVFLSYKFIANFGCPFPQETCEDTRFLQWSFTTGNTVQPIPDPPTNLAGSANSTTSILWDWNPSAGATFYRFNGNAIGSVAEHIQQGLTPNFLSANNTVTACNSSGCGGNSNAASRYTLAATPSGLTGTPQCNAIKWKWNHGGNPVGTKYYVDTDASSKDWDTAVSYPPGEPDKVEWTQQPLSPGNITASVKAKNGDNIETLFSSSASASALAAPAAPSGFSTSNITSSTITWSWGAVSGATSYSISIDSGSGYVYKGNQDGTITTYTATGLACGQSHTIKVVANNSCGHAEATNQANTSACPVSGVCGSANGQTYPSSRTSYSPDVQCYAGNSSNTAFPAQGGSVNWVCQGLNGGSNSPNCSASRLAMTGSLTASNCTIPAGDNKCNSSLTWSTINPIATSAVTSDKDNNGNNSSNFTVFNGNSGTNQTAPIFGSGPSGNGSRNFYLYNNAQLLDQETPTASCASGTTWTNGICAANVVPTVASPTHSSVTSTSATLGANVTSLGIPASISARGTCFGTSSSPTGNCLAEGGTSTGVFSHSRTGLSCGTTYYYRGYADNSTGRGYSSDGTFNTPACPVNGVCGGTINSCSAGTFQDIADDATQIKWNCNGLNGGSNVSCAVDRDLSNSPDLTAGGATPVTATAGVGQTYSATITNQGSVSTGATFPYFFQTATAGNGGGTITDLSSSTMGSLAGGGSGTATSPSVTFSSAGTYSVRVCADKTSSAGGGVIWEANEGNNCGGWVNVTVNPGANVSPLANAGPDKSITLPTSSTSPTGTSATDPDGTVVSTIWTQTSGPSASISYGSTLNPTFSNMTTAGTYVFRLTVTDNLGATSFDEMQVAVSGNSMSGTLAPATSSSCTIPAGSGSCSLDLNWGITNPEAVPTAITASGMTNIDVSNSLTPASQAGTQLVTVPYNSRTFFLYNNSVELAQTATTASCASGSSWNGSQCSPITPFPSATLSASPSIVNPGGASTLTWSSSNTTSCTSLTPPFDTGGATSGTFVVSPSETTEYGMNCVGPGGQITVSTTVFVTTGKKPIFIEE